MDTKYSWKFLRYFQTFLESFLNNTKFYGKISTQVVFEKEIIWFQSQMQVQLQNIQLKFSKF